MSLLEGLGIKLEVDDASIQKSLSVINNAIGKNTGDAVTRKALEALKKEQEALQVNKRKKEVAKDLGVNLPKGEGGGVFAGSLLGTLLGNILSQLKPVTQFLSAIAAVLTVALAPLLPILKIFLTLMIFVAKKLNEWLTSAIKDINTKTSGKSSENVLANNDVFKTNKGDSQMGFVDDMKAIWKNFIDSLFEQDWGSVIGINLSAVVATFAEGIGNILFGLIDIFRGITDLVVGIFTRNWAEAWNGIKEIVNGVWEIFKGVLQTVTAAAFAVVVLVIGLPGKIAEIIVKVVQFLWKGLTDFFTGVWAGLKDLGKWVWDKITGILGSAFNVLSGIGQWIWNKITSMIGLGKHSTSAGSVDDGIISGGKIITTDPADYIIATKNPQSLMNGPSNTRADNGPVNVYVQGFVGDEEQLAYKIAKALGSTSRGGSTNW